MKSLLQLADEMERLAVRVPERANELKKQVALVILQDLTNITPVDQGKALSNWQVSLDVPNTTQIPAYVPSPRGRMIKGIWTHSVEPAITRAANAPETFDVGKAVIAAAQPGQSIFITNAQPYIRRLNDGYSQQAPARFVESAILLGRLFLDKVRGVR